MIPSSGTPQEKSALGQTGYLQKSLSAQRDTCVGSKESVNTEQLHNSGRVGSSTCKRLRFEPVFLSHWKEKGGQSQKVI